MKRVLFVSDYFTHGGLETRTLELVSFYKKHGIESFLACDVLAPEHKAVFEDTLQLPLLDTSFYTIIQNFSFVLPIRNYKDNIFCHKYILHQNMFEN